VQFSTGTLCSFQTVLTGSAVRQKINPQSATKLSATVMGHMKKSNTEIESYENLYLL
jgi:hypothetical protein